MERLKLTISENKELCSSTYKMVLNGNVPPQKAGAFLELSLDGFYLNRPFGVADATPDAITVLYKVQGRGTDYMTSLKSGTELNALIGLGNGFDTAKTKKPLLVAGGIGLAPLYYLAKRFSESGIRSKAIVGFRNKEEAFYVDELSSYADVTVATDDGSLGFAGNAVHALSEISDLSERYYYACGALPMLRALQKTGLRGEMSLEARMGCGFGACMGCTIKTKNGFKRVCKEGPVFPAEEVIFDD